MLQSHPIQRRMGNPALCAEAPSFDRMYRKQRAVPRRHWLRTRKDPETHAESFTGYYFPHGCWPFALYAEYPVDMHSPTPRVYPPADAVFKRLWPHIWLYLLWIR